MPNWCNNNFTVHHEDPAMLIKFQEALKAGELFQTFVPLSSGEWDYDTALTEWGTKWEPNGGDCEIDADGRFCNGWFDTAWGPGIRAYEKMSELGFEIDIVFHEPGMCFAGRFTSPDEEYYVEYNFANENWRDDVDDDQVLELLEYEYESWLEWNEENKEEDGSE
jgi:hypothetical protein